VNYFDEQKTRELLALKKRLGYDDVRFRDDDCVMCGESSFDDSYSDFVPRPKAFQPECAPATGPCARNGSDGQLDGLDTEELVQAITERVMEALAGAGVR
jgi:L-fuculose-phosphate aldolase